MSPRLSSFLDLSRWMAAAAVIVGHMSRVIFSDGALRLAPGPLMKAVYIVTNLGHQAVMVFFVISGFLVGGVSIDKIRSGRFSLGDYAASRFSRIYAVLAPALLIGAGLDLIGARFADASHIYSTVRPMDIESLLFGNTILDRLNWPTFLGNLFMLEGIAVDQLGSNGPLWSLAYEWWYYCLFAAAVIAWTVKPPAIRLGALAAAAVMLFLLPLKITVWGVIWLLGMAAALYLRSRRRRPPAWAGIGVFVVGILLSKAVHHFETPGELVRPFAGDLAAGVGFSVLLVSFGTGERALAGARLHRWAADFSYSTYLAHFPFMLLCVALAHDYLRVPIAARPSGSGALEVLLLGCVVLAYCYAFSRAFEAQTPKLKALLWRRPRAIAIAAE